MLMDLSQVSDIVKYVVHRLWSCHYPAQPNDGNGKVYRPYAVVGALVFHNAILEKEDPGQGNQHQAQPSNGSGLTLPDAYPQGRALHFAQVRKLKFTTQRVLDGGLNAAGCSRRQGIL